jgi:hypothetical protein
MNVNLGDADAGVSVAIWVLNDYFQELQRIGRLPQRVTLQSNIGGQASDVTLLMDPPRFEMVKPASGEPYTRMQFTGSTEVRPAGDPSATPQTSPLDVTAKLAIVLVPTSGTSVVGIEYQGIDEPPSGPLSAGDVDALFATADFLAVIAAMRLDLASILVLGLSISRADGSPTADWQVVLTMMPGGSDTDDAFAVTVGLPSSTSVPVVRESFVAKQTGLGLAYNRSFLDLMLSQGAAARVGTKVDDAKITRLMLQMTDTAIQVDGHSVREVTALPDVDVDFVGPMHPFLVRGTTVMSFDMKDVVVDVDDSDEIFYAIAKWFFTIVAGAFLISGFASLTIAGIVLWVTAVQKFWGADVEIGNAPGLVRDSLATSLANEASLLAFTLDDDYTAGSVTLDATPDRLEVSQGSMVFAAQVLVKPMMMRLASAEYSKKLRRFVIFELEDGRRFRAQELARLMASGKITVPGFHQVDGNYLRANPDDAEANNLLREWKANITEEVVVKSVRQ